MPAQYFLPCSCGQKHVVSVAQAGQTLQCACGAKLDVPTLRGLSALEAVPDQVRPARSTWGPRQGVVLVAGALAAVALLAAGWLSQQSRLGVALTSAEAETMDSLTPAQSLQAWRFFSSQGLNSGFDTAAMEQAHFAGLWVYVALAVAALALAVAVLSAAAPLLLRRPPTKSPGAKLGR